MLEQWTGDLIGKMHVNKITFDDLAIEMGVTKSYVSMILNGARKPPNIEQRMEEAYNAALARKQESLLRDGT